MTHGHESQRIFPMWGCRLMKMMASITASPRAHCRDERSVTKRHRVQALATQVHMDYLHNRKLWCSELEWEIGLQVKSNLQLTFQLVCDDMSQKMK